MRCPACGRDNSDGAKFCRSCGLSLAVQVACAACGTKSIPDSAFCEECGAALAAAAPASTTERPAPSAPPLPTAFAGGRYNVRSFLGEGAKKRVYLAHDTKLDRDVAFALIKTDGLDADGLVRVRREAQAMGRLGDNAHIVTIHDTGDEGGAPFIVSQLMAGGSVEDLLAKAEQHRIAPDRAMKIAEQVCQALQHAHGRGVIHRDLKPGNVWLDMDGNAALGDFGLAIAIDRSRMTKQGMMVGTVAYMAPEQALGRTPDARSDLYALGAMLYEMVTGRPPFLGDDAVGVISQHINTKPLDPTWHNPQCPKPLEALILHLLAKSPDERPASAAEAAQELRRILDRSTVEPPPAAQGPDAISDLRGLNWGFFVGRREEMDGLKDALEDALSGKGSLAMLVGEPGIGKTRLAEEFGVYAGLRGAQVVTGHCYEGEASLPYRPFVEAFRQYTRSRPDAELRTQLGPGAPEIATLVSEIRTRFPDIEEAPKLDPEAERLRLFESVTEFLHNASTAQPLVLHFDDLHWADKPSLLLLLHLAQRGARDRLLVLGAYRDVELDRSHPLSEALGALRRLPNYRRVLLRGLPLESVADLLGVVEPSEEAAAGRQALAAALHQETEGNPFFIREVLAHLIETGKLVHENGRWVGRVTSVSELGIPEGVREVIGRRLTRLSDGCNRMLTLASTMTGGFSWDALKAINGVAQPVSPAQHGSSAADAPTEAQLLDLLEEALGAQLLAERKGEGAGSYDFTHALIRQTLYEELSTPRRVLLHRQIGEALEQLYAHNIEPHLAVLAHHFYQAAPGGDVEKAIDYARRAGDRAVELLAYEEAAGHYERALQASELTAQRDDRATYRLLMGLGTAYVRADVNERATECMERAAKLADSLGDPLLRANAALAFDDAMGRGPLATKFELRLAVLRKALAELGERDDGLKSRLLGKLSLVLMTPTGPTDESIELAKQAIALAEQAGDFLALSEAFNALQFALVGPQHTEERLSISNDRLHAAERSGDKHQLLFAHEQRMGILADLGEMEEVDRELAIICDMADRMREPAFSANRPFWGCMRAAMEGRYAEAERLALQALAVAQRMQQPFFLVQVYSQFYDIRRSQARLGEFEQQALLNHEQFPEFVVGLVALAFVYLETDRLDLAREWFERVGSEGYPGFENDVNLMTTSLLGADLARALNDRTRAEALYRVLLPHAARNIRVFNTVVCAGSAAGPLGVLAATMRRWEDAEQHFEHALAFDEKIRAWPWLARTRYQFALMLSDRDAAGDRERAVPLVNQAIATFDELGMKKDLERALTLKLELQGAAASGLYTSIDAVARAVRDERPALPQQALAPDGTVTIMFSDIEDSTVLTERLGDQAWQELLRKHNALIREQLRAHGGYEVKTMGDGFMVAFQSAKKGLECAIAIQRAFAEHNAIDGEHVNVRIGLHAGETIKDGDDFYGKNVILASRVAGKAAGGEILVSSLLRQLVESSTNASIFGEPRDVELKGLAGTHAIYAVQVA